MFDRTYYATHPDMMVGASNDELRDRYLIQNLFRPNQCVLNYTHADRLVIGGVLVDSGSVKLPDQSEPASAAGHPFLERRELGIVNVGRITLNLNEPSKVPGIGQWFKPGKYVGIWWEMHLEKSTWGSGPKHGANTANVKRHIDFAAKYGFEGVLVEGWNEGWDGDWIANGDKFSFTRAYPDFDLAEIMRYGKAKGVKLIGQSTLATQLAEYVVIYSPIQMAADLPENYEARPDAFRFSRDVPADWEQSRTLQGAIGDEETRELRQPLAFLAPGARYEAQIYADGPAAYYRSNPGALTIEKRMVTSGDTLTLRLAPGGGTAIRFRRVD